MPAPSISPSPKRGSWSWKPLAISPLLMLCAACSTTGSRPSVTPAAGPLGNSYRLLLPAGTRIEAPTDQAAAQLAAVAVNELSQIEGRRVTLGAALQLVSPAYIHERNSAEATLRLRLSELAQENTRLRDALSAR